MTMKEVKSSLRYLRMAPRKVRVVADLIKGLDINQARAILRFQRKRAAKPILKLLESAVANAKNNFKLPESDLYVKEIRVNRGPMLKRWMPRAMGRATMIQKKSSHIDLILGLREKVEKKFEEARVKEETEITREPEIEKVLEGEKKEVKPVVSKIEEKKESRIKQKLPKKIRMPSLKPVVRKIFRRKSI